ncbi:MAG TPA: 30S ribosome-binding factor RbfA [Thermoleophilaceae bacterium]
MGCAWRGASSPPTKSLGTRMPGSRMRRVNEAVREVLSGHITEDLKDPRIGFVTVTGVETSPDLRHARVYVSVLGSDDQKADALKGLQSSAGFLQAKVAQELRMKHTPTLEFHYDDSVDRGMRITELLDDREGEGEWE